MAGMAGRDLLSALDQSRLALRIGKLEPKELELLDLLDLPASEVCIVF